MSLASDTFYAALATLHSILLSANILFFHFWCLPKTHYGRWQKWLHISPIPVYTLFRVWLCNSCNQEVKSVFICQKFGLNHMNSFDQWDVAKVTQAKTFKAIVHWGLPSLFVDNLGPMLWWKMRDLWKNCWLKHPNHSRCCHSPADTPADCKPYA